MLYVETTVYAPGLPYSKGGKHMAKKHYPIVIEQDRDGVFIVDCPVFEGCRSYGKTIDEALANISEAIQACVEDIGQDRLDELSSFIGVRDVEVAEI